MNGSKTAPRSSNSSWRNFLLPSATDLVFLGLLFSLSCTALASRLLGDAGIGWHIRNGQLMLQSHAVTRSDPFSFTMNGQPWYAWEWVYDLLVAAIHHAMGLNGVVLFAALVIAATFALTFRTTIKRGGNPPVTIVLLALALGASAIHLFARPHVFSWLFAVTWFRVLDSGESSPCPANVRRLYWLPVLMVLWVNLHGGFVTGFVLFGIFLVSGLVWSWSGGSDAIPRGYLKRLVAVTALSFVATFANPYGYKLHQHIYGYLTNHFLMNHIQEFRSPDFHGAAAGCFVLLLMIAFLTLAVARQRPNVSQVLVIIFSAGSGLYSARNLPVSSILLTLTIAPLLSRAVADAANNANLAAGLRAWFSRWNAFGTRMRRMELPLRGYLWSLAGAFLGLWIALYGGKLGGTQLMAAQFPARRFPVQAVDRLVGSGGHEPVFCTDEWGGYLIYRLYPQRQVMVDDRHDLYGEEFFKQYLKVVNGQPRWSQILIERHVNVALVPDDSPIANLLKDSPEWAPLYQDSVGDLFQRVSFAEDRPPIQTSPTN